MHFSKLVMPLAASLLCTVASAAYSLVDNFDHTNFYKEFDFFQESDPTKGFVKYIDGGKANQTDLAGLSGDAIFMGVDSTSVNPPGGRDSVRLTSRKSWTKGLFIADIAHMPGSICGAWPAFWTFGPHWPHGGEIDILEGVHNQKANIVTLHTSAGCVLGGVGSLATSKQSTPECSSGIGCGFQTENPLGYGDGFNAAGGGVYAMDWTSEAIRVYFFPRGAIPADILAGTPSPDGWGVPTAMFSGHGCDIDTHFRDHSIVFDTTFCGDWAGPTWHGSTCASKANTCEQYVAENPKAFTDAYWLVNWVRVFQ